MALTILNVILKVTREYEGLTMILQWICAKVALLIRDGENPVKNKKFARKEETVIASQSYKSSPITSQSICLDCAVKNITNDKTSTQMSIEHQTGI